MSRTINLMIRDDGVATIYDDTYDITIHCENEEEQHKVVELLKSIPSAQPEIIRCKDCKFWKAYGYINGKPEFLPKCGFNQIYTNKDDFCSRAERKGNERPD